MDTAHQKALAKLIRDAREELGLSARELARRSGVNDSNIVRLEQAAVPYPRPETLLALAEALHLEITDVYAAAGHMAPTSLPSFFPYLRSRYPDLPAAAKRELEESFKQIADKYGYDPTGPRPGEDEH